jgi:tetratricopeptide (TPR) repeat protein
LEQYQRQVAEKPDNADARSVLGSAYNNLGMFAEAEVEYLKAIELEPTNWNFYNLLAIDYSEWGRLDKAIEYYKKAIDLKPHHVLYLGLGEAYERQGKPAEAITAYQESIKIKPTFTYGLYNLALIYSKQDRYQDAIELLRKVVELEPRNTFAQHALGVVYIQTGEKAPCNSTTSSKTSIQISPPICWLEFPSSKLKRQRGLLLSCSSISDNWIHLKRLSTATRKSVDEVAIKKREARLVSLLNRSAKADSVKKELYRN